jgi:membrane-bound ClpP family serine protease
MKELFKSIKQLLLHPTLHSLVLALTAMYLIFGVMNAGFIMLSVVANLVDFFFHHSSTHGDIIHIWYRAIVFG